MKKMITITAMSIITLAATAQNKIPNKGAVGIGTKFPHASAILDVDTTGMGVLIPRMTKAQRDAIVSPATSLLIYQTDNIRGFYYFDVIWKLFGPKEVQIIGDNFFIVGDYLVPLTTGTGNTAVGNGAFSLNDSGSDNCAVGYLSLGLNTSGRQNTAMGYRSMLNNQNGYGNVAIGYGTLMNSTTGLYNTAVGSESLMNQSFAGWGNAAFGQRTLIDNHGSGNSAIGSYSMVLNTSGAYNTVVGISALNKNTTGNHNTGVGSFVLSGNVTGSFNTAIGDSANVSSGALSNATAIGYKAKATASNMVQLGNNAVTSVKAGNNIVIVSDGRFKKNLKNNVPGLEFIRQLNPVTYNYDIHSLDAHTSPKSTGIKTTDGATEKNVSGNEYEKAVLQKEQKIYTGFVAQEVEKAADKLGYNFSGIYKPQNDQDAYGLSYADFVVPLVKAVQELDKENKQLKADVQEMKLMISALQTNSNTSRSVPDVNNGILGQNQPNPFTGETFIPVHLPKQAANASIVITETSSGKKIKTIVVATDAAQVKITASAMAPGNYTYTLFADGKKIASKQMVYTGK